MFKNYLKIALRGIWKKKLFSTINIVGLGLGMAASLLIMEYVSYETSYENMHKERERIYRVIRKQSGGEQVNFYASNMPALGPALREEFPEVERYTRVISPEKLMSSFAFSYQRESGAITFNVDDAYYVDNDFIRMFSYDWVEGDSETALQDPNSLVLTETLARNFFGDTPAVGKQLALNGDRLYVVSGVIADLEPNSHLQFDLLASFSSLPARWELDTNWGWGNFYTYIQTDQHRSVEELMEKFNPFLFDLLDQNPDEGLFEVVPQPLASIHLQSDVTFEMGINGNSNVVYFLTFVAFFILMIAWVNYINLSTARSQERAKEVGIRKTMGSTRKLLIRQFLMESTMINLVSLGLCITLFQLFQPIFEAITGVTSIAGYISFESLLIFAIVFVMGTLLSGFYPALVMSSFKPVTTLKGKLNESGGLNLRKALTIFQYTVSILFISGTLIVFQQIDFMRNQDLGISLDQTVVLRKAAVVDSTYPGRYRYFKQQLLQNPNIAGVSSSSQVPGYELTRARWIHRFNGDENIGSYPKVVSIDEDFINNFNIELLAGRDFSNETSTTAKFIINDVTAEELGIDDYEEAIGTHYAFESRRYELIGIVKSFSQEFLKKQAEPHFYYINERIDQYISVKLAIEDLEKDMASINAAYRQAFPNNHFEYFFLDSFFEKQYRADQVFGQVFGLFAIVAIAIAMLGLFGLSSYMVLQRTKEIGIRKVLGAKVSSILGLLMASYLKLIAVAAIIGLPITYFVFQQWLDSYATKIQIGWLVMSISVLAVMLVALITIGYQSVKAATANPVNSLRYE